ncbi:hypothetical protein ENUP19_0082G0118 [Entamoeba nuttalli]|uniref:Leucine rich repeat protein, BspA family protein n=2 Tax=Entamoeba nuttalli TaxID=412467 RepID=K2H4Q8_ENTNP|nr:leucine rich repeat protein, BspA family protein [Entamoeba nuttalli P19]EKE41327.1 leucine rich repeat protein, BspA family protein [Entamoeba nuttalli P19]|eukprot:XP_008856332.1 leucine rich repeat protein, BspA family protein [Entamoeba nuttalli P19]
MGLVDRYSMLIIAQYFPTINDLFHVMLVNKKFINLNELFHYNPYDISINQLKYFPYLHTLHFYKSITIHEVPKVFKIVIHFDISYFQLLNYQKKFQRKVEGKRVILTEIERNDLNIYSLDEVPSEVTILGQSCFALLDIESLNFSPQIHEIHENCFNGIDKCSSLVIPTTLTFIDQFSFSNSSLKSITIHDGILLRMKAFDYCGDVTEIHLTSGKKFHGFVDTSLQELFKEKKIETPNVYFDTFSIAFLEDASVIPKEYKYITDYCFNEEIINTIHLSEGIIHLGIRTFKNCYSLTNIYLPNSLTSIGKGCFSGCSSLSQITIPSNITSIPQKCFKNCRNLSSISFNGKITEFGFEWNKNTQVLCSVEQEKKKEDGSFNYNKNKLLQIYFECHSN